MIEYIKTYVFNILELNIMTRTGFFIAVAAFLLMLCTSNLVKVNSRRKLHSKHDNSSSTPASRPGDAKVSISDRIDGLIYMLGWRAFFVGIFMLSIGIIVGVTQ